MHHSRSIRLSATGLAAPEEHCLWQPPAVAKAWRRRLWICGCKCWSCLLGFRRRSRTPVIAELIRTSLAFPQFLFRAQSSGILGFKCECWSERVKWLRSLWDSSGFTAERERRFFLGFGMMEWREREWVGEGEGKSEKMFSKNIINPFVEKII